MLYLAIFVDAACLYVTAHRQVALGGGRAL